MSEELEFVIRANGEVELKTHGIKGRRCLDFLRVFEQAIGRTKKVEHTPEIYEEEAVLQADQRVQQRLER